MLCKIKGEVMAHGSQTLCPLTFLSSTGLLAAARPWVFWATGFVFPVHGTEEQRKPPPFPAKLSHCPGGIGVWDHTLFICGSFKWCPETHISCSFGSVYVTGEAVKQQSALTPVIYLFSYMSACSSLSHNSLPCPKVTGIWGCRRKSVSHIYKDFPGHHIWLLIFQLSKAFCLFVQKSFLWLVLRLTQKEGDKKKIHFRGRKKYESSQNKLNQIPWKCWKLL